MLITSSNNDKIKKLKRLELRKYRELNELFLVEGKHLVIEAYKSGNLIEVLIDENESIDIDIKQTHVTSNVLKELSNLTNAPKIIGVCRRLEPKTSIGNRVLMLDNIQDPGNLGTIIRSAVAFNIDTIVLGNGSVDVYNPKVIRATQGLIFHINIIEEHLYSLISQLKQDNYTIIGTKVDGGSNLKTFNKTNKFALIMGNEGHGMDNNLEPLCDKFIYIVMNNACESLNVSVACSIILYQLDE
jgi:TrmH family RNA methyltransferase